MSPLLLVLTFVTAAPDGHLGQNPVYKNLREEGVAVAPGKMIPLPEPKMADGLSAAEQRKVIEEVGGRRYSFAQLTRDSRVAPDILYHPRGKVMADGVKVETADAYFVAYGDLETIAGNQEKNNPENADTDWTNLDAEDLDARGIKLLDPKYDGYGHISRNVLNKVQVDVTLRNYWSQTDDSIVMANVLDPRFDDDKEFPNQWRPIERRPNGVPMLGNPQPYSGVGCYIKITELKQPAGALFIEMHIVYTEPEEWFGGSNVLGSKLKMIFQTEVRDARGDLDQQ